METMTIDAASAETARAMIAALSGFQAELVETPRGNAVVITLGKGDGEIVGVLNALQQYVTARGDGPAHVDFNGRRYVMDVEPQPSDP
jgi:hypothetical protein